MVLREVMGQAPKQFSAATKTFCTELEQRIAGFCASALGADAMLAEPGLGGRVARNLCYAPAYTIMGGTSQILRTSWASASSACPGARDTSLAELEPQDGRKRPLLDLPDAPRRIGDDCPVAADAHQHGNAACRDRGCQ